MSKAIWWIIIIVILIVGGYWLFQNYQATTPEDGSESPEESSASGQLIFSITDAAANMSNISEVNMTISEVAVQSATRGWVTVSSAPRTYNLLELKAKSESKLLASSEVAAENYNQVRVTISKVEVKKKDGTTAEAQMPSHDLRISGSVLVEDDKTASVNLDFIADASLHTDTQGKYVFAPVVKLDSRSGAEVTVASDNTVVITNGVIRTDVTVGMDLKGEVKTDFRLEPTVQIKL